MLQFQRSWEINGMSIIIPPPSISFKLLSTLKGRENLEVFLWNFRSCIFSSLLYHGVLDAESVLRFYLPEGKFSINLVDWDRRRPPRKAWPPSKSRLFEVHKTFHPNCKTLMVWHSIRLIFLSVSFFPTFPISLLINISYSTDTH